MNEEENIYQRSTKWYLFEAICDHPGCNTPVDRGLAYACGGMHGEDEYSCEGYFCDDHLYYTKYEGKTVCVCEECVKLIEEGEDDC